MNVENIKRVRDHIAKIEEHRFNMASYFSSDDGEAGAVASELVHDCGSAACICGWAVAVLAPDTLADHVSSELGGKLLGLSPDEAMRLFMPPNFAFGGGYTQAEGVAVLDRLLATGAVDWLGARADAA